MDVAVLGADRSGRAVARVCAVAGHEVSLYADDANAVMDGIDAVEARLSAGEEAAADRLSGTTGLDAAVGEADVVVETATDDEQRLRGTLADVEAGVDRETLVALAASGVSVTAAAAGLRHPDRAVGLRFCDPLAAPLVEVVVADQTSRETAERARSLVEGLDRTPVVVRDAPGGVSTRAALALEAEAMRLVEEGVAGVEAIDDALELGLGHDAGPLERADRAGLDDRLDALEHLRAQLGSRFEPPDVLRDLVADGKTGGPTGEGFYAWENGEPTEPALPDPEIPDRDRLPDDPASE